jgi:SecD/SecF fusion protein
MEQMKNNPKSVLLMERALGKNFQNELLEIVFSDSGEQPAKEAAAAETPAKIQPAKLTFHFVSDPDPALDLAQGLIPGTIQPIFYVKEPVMSNKDVAGAKANVTAMYGEATYLIEVNLTDEGTKKFARITKDNIGKDLAIVIDGKIIMAPKIQTPILDGKCQIQGSFTKAEAEEVALKINAGLLK